MLNPAVGQIVRHNRLEGKMIVRSVSENGVTVELLPISGEEGDYIEVPVTELVQADELSEA